MTGGAILERLQPLGRALMLPIAVLPIAALLLRLGQPDMLDVAFIAAAREVIFSNLKLLMGSVRVGGAVHILLDGDAAAVVRAAGASSPSLSSRPARSSRARHSPACRASG